MLPATQEAPQGAGETIAAAGRGSPRPPPGRLPRRSLPDRRFPTYDEDLFRVGPSARSTATLARWRALEAPPSLPVHAVGGQLLSALLGRHPIKIRVQ